MLDSFSPEAFAAMLDCPTPPSWSDSAVRVFLAALPTESFLRIYTIYAAHVNSAPLASHVAAGLALLGIAAPWGTTVHIGQRAIPTNIWTVSVGNDSANTSALSVAQALLRHAINGSVAERQIGGYPGSVEGLFSSLQEAPHQIIFFADGLSGFLARTASGKRMEDLRAVLAATYHGESQAQNYSAKKVICDHPCISLASTVLPEVLLTKTSPSDWSSQGGLLTNCIFLAGEARVQKAVSLGGLQRTDLLALASERLSAIGEWSNRAFDSGIVPTGYPCAGLTEQALANWTTGLAPLFAVFGAATKAHKELNGMGAAMRPLAMRLAMLCEMATLDAPPATPWHLDGPAVSATVELLAVHLQAAAWFAVRAPESPQHAAAISLLDLLFEPRPSSTVFRSLDLSERAINELLALLRARGQVACGTITKDGVTEMYYWRVEKPPEEVAAMGGSFDY